MSLPIEKKYGLRPTGNAPPTKRPSRGMAAAISAAGSGAHGCVAIARVGRANRVPSGSANLAEAHLEAAQAAAFIIVIAAPEPRAPRPFCRMARHSHDDERDRQHGKHNDPHRASPVQAWPRRNARARNRAPDGSGGTTCRPVSWRGERISPSPWKL